MARSLNKVELIGNLTRDPELKYTGQGTAVCTFSIATNRQWTTESGEKKDEVEFHNIVAWRNLAESCSKYLKKGSRAYLEGRLQTRKWTGQDGNERRTTEVIANDVIFLDPRGGVSDDDSSNDFDIPDDPIDFDELTADDSSTQSTNTKKKSAKTDEVQDEEAGEDIPF